eukprot:scaffold11190_cov32-Attheya_sp.AAC.4
MNELNGEPNAREWYQQARNEQQLLTSNNDTAIMGNRLSEIRDTGEEGSSMLKKGTYLHVASLYVVVAAGTIILLYTTAASRHDCFVVFYDVS